MSVERYRYCLSENDKMIIKSYTKKPLSSNAEKTLTILSEVFGGIHHLESDQLKLFDYQSAFYNQYLLGGSLATFDDMKLTCLVVIAHDMAVRLEIQPMKFSVEESFDDDFDMKFLKKQLEYVNSEHDYNISIDEFASQKRPYLRLLFHERKRDGGFSERHPTLEDSADGFRKNNKVFA